MDNKYEIGDIIIFAGVMDISLWIVEDYQNHKASISYLGDYELTDSWVPEGYSLFSDIFRKGYSVSIETRDKEQS